MIMSCAGEACATKNVLIGKPIKKSNCIFLLVTRYIYIMIAMSHAPEASETINVLIGKPTKKKLDVAYLRSRKKIRLSIFSVASPKFHKKQRSLHL